MTGLSIHRIRDMYVCNDGVGAQRSAEGSREHSNAPHRGGAMAAGYNCACDDSLSMFMLFMPRSRLQRACTDIAQLVTAFDNDNLRTPTGPFDYLLDFSHGLFVFDQCLYYISTIIGDAVVVRTSSGYGQGLRKAEDRM